MSIDRHSMGSLSRPLRRLVLLLLGVVLGLRALMLPLDMAGHAAQLPAAVWVSASGAAVAMETSPGFSQGGESKDVSPLGDPACHDRHDAAPAHDPSADARVCQILCAVACAPLLLPMPLLVAHDGGEHRRAPAPLLPRGIASAPEHRPPIA